jgi:hypothetical protein
MFCCSKLFPDEKLTMQREDYIGSELRIDGYYYTQTGSVKDSVTAVIFLFRNGITVTCGAFLTTDLNVVDEELPNRYKWVTDKLSFGIFLIRGNEILMEGWNTAGGGMRLPIVRDKGYIENDTTFCITESYYSDIKETHYGNRVWHFKQFDNKPDSTNNYIK